MTSAMNIEPRRPNEGARHRPREPMSPRRPRLVGLVLLGGMGCASFQLPADQIERYEASVHVAQKLGAVHVPAQKGHVGGYGMSFAKEHLILADDEAEVAKAMAADGDARATLLLARAQSDVDLSIGLTREAAMGTRARESTEKRKRDRLARAWSTPVASIDPGTSR
jgi:hypothetical protein